MRAELLLTVPAEEVWGIGGASATKLAKLGIQTAADLATLEPDDACALTTVTGGRTVYELRWSAQVQSGSSYELQQRFGFQDDLLSWSKDLRHDA